MDITPRSSRAQTPVGNGGLNDTASLTRSIPHSGPGARRNSEPLFDNDHEALFDFEDHGLGEDAGRGDEDDGPDLDELLAMEEMQREEGTTAGASGAADTGVEEGLGKGLPAGASKGDSASGTGTSKDAPSAVEEEEDEWGGLYD